MSISSLSGRRIFRKDAHLKHSYSSEAQPVPPEGKEIVPETLAEKNESRQGAQAKNFGFDRIERLPGNVGYLKMNSFVRPDFAGDTAGRAMAFLANTDALIIDLRTSGGGSPDMVTFMASYFFDDEPYRLGNWYTRAEKGVHQLWTMPYVPGSRFLDKPVYILVSASSFSAVEGLAMILQHHKRAVIVGEKTRGGTHPGCMVRIHPNFAVFVPTSWFIFPTGTPTFPIGRPLFPTEKADTVATAVTPDIAASSAEALKRAHIEALRKIIEKDPSAKERLERIIRSFTEAPR